MQLLKNLTLITLISLFTPGILSAKVICVDVNNKAEHGDGSCWQNPYSHLEAALSAAKANPQIDQIWIAKGIYRPTKTYSPYNNQHQEIEGGAFALQNTPGITIKGKLINYSQNPAQFNEFLKTFELVDGVNLYGGFQGFEKSLAERDKNPAKHATILDGNLGHVSVWHVLSAGNDLTRLGVKVTLDRLTVRNGQASNAPYFPTHFPLNKQQIPIYYHDDGGGLYVFASSTITLNHVLFSDNHAVAGGAIFVQDGSKLIVNRCTFTNNQALNGAAINARHGGPNEFRKNAERKTTVIINNSRFAGNKSEQSPVIFGNDNQLFPDMKNTKIFYWKKLNTTP